MAAPQSPGSSSPSPDGKSLGMGGEAVEHVHAQQQDSPDPGAASQQNAAATGRGDGGSDRGDGADRAGSEPLERTREHVPSYGGMGGVPRVSSDQREPANPSGAAPAGAAPPGGQADENDPPYPTPS